MAHYCPLCEREVEGKKKTSSIIALAIIGMVVLGGLNWGLFEVMGPSFIPRVDEDGDGYITAAELRENYLLEWTVADRDGDGYISYDEYVQYLDINNDGHVSDTEFGRGIDEVQEMEDRWFTMWMIGLIGGNIIIIVIGAVLYRGTAEVCPICGSKVEKNKGKSKAESETSYCPECGKENPADARVCSYCGANMAER